MKNVGLQVRFRRRAFFLQNKERTSRRTQPEGVLPILSIEPICLTALFVNYVLSLCFVGVLT